MRDCVLRDDLCGVLIGLRRLSALDVRFRAGSAAVQLARWHQVIRL
jgi:hypothetical protein